VRAHGLANANHILGAWRSGAVLVDRIRVADRPQDAIPNRPTDLLSGKGHISYPAAMWGLEGAPDSRLYVSEWREKVLGDRPNRPYQLIMKDKLLFWVTMRALTPRVTPLWGFVQRGRYWSVDRPKRQRVPTGAGICGAALILGHEVYAGA
jgi:hypothetical protein